LLDDCLSPVRAEFARALLLWGTDVDIAGQSPFSRGDHAAREETSFGLHLFPDLVDVAALRAGRSDEAWPGGTPPGSGRPEVVCRNPADALFGQAGEDARRATAEHGREVLEPVVSWIAEAVERHLGTAW